MSHGNPTFKERMKVSGDLGLLLCEHLWNSFSTYRLGDGEYEVIGGEEVPGYEDDDFAVLLRRKSDGQVFEADIDVSIRPVRRFTEQAVTS